MGVAKQRGRPQGTFRLRGVGVIFCLVCCSVVRADLFDGYALVESFALPAGAGPFTTLADGRVLTIVSDELFVETGPGLRAFNSLGVLPAADIPSFGAAFLVVSPDQTKVAVGNNGGASFSDFAVGVFDLNTLDGTWFSANHFLAQWVDNTNLAIAASDFFDGSSATVLDTTSPSAATPVNTIIIEQKGGASGGIAFDAAGNLFKANGFASLGPSDTGAIKAFAVVDWMNALATGTPINFETGGTFVLDILNGTPLGFDADGNLFAGGGSDPPDVGFLAVVRASAVSDALGGAGPIDPNDASVVRRLDPIPTGPANRYSAVFNAARGELYVRDLGDDTVYVYADAIPVPAVSEWGLIASAMLMLTGGTIFLRRATSTT